MKHLFIFISILLLSFPVIGQSKETCYVSVEGSKEFNLNLFSQISKSLISQYFKPIKNIPPGGIRSDSCVYEITVTKEGDTTFVVFSGEDLNSYGDSKLYGSDGFQQSLLKSLYRSLEHKRKKICEDYGELLKKCGSVVVQDIPKKVTIPKVEPKVVEIPKKVQVPFTAKEINQVIQNIGQKTTNLDEIQGQYIGLMMFKGKSTEIIKNFYDKMKKLSKVNENPLNSDLAFELSYMTDFLQGLVNEKYRIKAILIKNGWLELDSMHDYEIYNKLYEEGNLSNFLNIKSDENKRDLKDEV